MIQRQYCLIVTVCRHYHTTFILLERHSSPLLWYNAYIACMSQFAVTMIQRLYCLYATVHCHYNTAPVLFVRHTTPSFRYNISIVWSSLHAVTLQKRLHCLIVTVCRHYVTTSLMFVRQSTPSVRYNVHIFERQSILSLLYNICIVWLSQYTITMIQRPCRLYVTLCRHYDTTSAMSVRHSMPSPCFFVFMPSYCTTWVLCYRHSSPSSWYVWGDVTQWGFGQS